MLNEITINGKTFIPYIDKGKIDEAIGKIAKEINEKYKDCSEKPVFAITLTGGLFFSTELLQKLDFDATIGFIKCSSYGDQMETSGTVKITIPLSLDIKGKDVIVLEDIVDSGKTWNFLHKTLMESGAKNVKIATLCLKEVPADTQHVDWYGFKVGQFFILGMGMDYAEQGRNLPIIYKLK